jgi:hypothetical protein
VEPLHPAVEEGDHVRGRSCLVLTSKEGAEQ